MNSREKKVDDLYPGINCAQTILSLYAEEIGIDKKTAVKISSGFGGGMACAETCGAVTGAYMVIGMKHGHSTSDPDKKTKTKQRILEFNEEFRAEHGSLICKNLIGYDISTHIGAEKAKEKGVFKNKCPVFLKTACNIIEKDF